MPVRRAERPRRSEHAAQGAGQLVGARGSLAAAVDAFEPGDGLLDLHAAHQCGDTLRIAVTAAREGHAADDVSVGFDVDLSRAGARGGIGESVEHVMRVWVRFALGWKTKKPLPGVRKGSFLRSDA